MPRTLTKKVARASSPRRSSPAAGSTPPRAQASDSTDTNTGSQSGYEGANQSPARSAFLQFPINSRKELDRITRVELLRKVRALDANLGIISRILQTTSKRAVGRGITVRPITQDEEWNELNRARFESWAGSPHVYSIDASRDLYEDQRYAVESLVGDGEFFEALTRTAAGAPMVQPLDPFEIDARSTPRWEQGIWTDAFLRPVFYAVRELPGPPAWSPAQAGFRSVPSDSMIHLFRRRRAKQVRGITWFYSGMNQGIDVLDLRALETGTAKLHSALAVTVKRSGKLNKQGAFGKIKGLNGETAVADDTRALEKIFGGGMINYLGEEGEVDLQSSQRPSSNLLAFLEFLYRDIACGFGLPLEVVYNLAGLNGANSRATLEDAQQFFDLVQDVIIWRHTRRLYVWNTAVAVKSGALRPCKDPTWWRASYRGPAKLTVDMGRTADANIKLIRNMALSHERLFDERGQDAREEILSEIRFVKWAKEQCEKEGIDFNLLWEPTPGAVTNVHVPSNEPS